MEINEQGDVIEKTYPSAPDADGFFFGSADDEEQSIYTKVYANGNKVKKTQLPSSSQEAIVRELLGKDTKEISRFMEKDLEKYQMAALTVATTIAGSRQQLEFFESMKMKDYTRILIMYQDLNF